MDKNYTVLVTGGAGFIGSHLVDRLVELGYNVRIIDNLSSGSLDNIKHHYEKKTVEFIRLDLKNREDLMDKLEGVDVVFHLAANPEVRVSTVKPEIHFNENILTTFNLLEGLRQKDIREIVFASSSSVYGEGGDIPISEQGEIKPVSVYGASKAACEMLMHAYSKLYDIRVIVLRYANIIGPRLRHGVLYDLLLKLSKNKHELEVLGDGSQTRSYLHVKDAVDASITAWLKSTREFDVFNVGNFDWITVRDIVSTILNTLKLQDIKVTYKPILHGVGWPGDVKKIILDITKLANLNWKPTFNSREAVESTVKSLVSELSLSF